MFGGAPALYVARSFMFLQNKLGGPGAVWSHTKLASHKNNVTTNRYAHETQLRQFNFSLSSDN
jgi:hypothetical protein